MTWRLSFEFSALMKMWLLAGALAQVGCGTADPAGAGDAGCFVAYPPQFDGFRSWTHYSYEGGIVAPPDAVVAAHLSGERTEYVNALPPADAGAFPAGTIIVKEIYASNPANDQLLAMVKRDCGYNAGGATGWEWMDLAETPGGASIVWRGSQPPAGTSYAGQHISCNDCHASCTDNDSVCSPNIRLGKKP